MITLGDILKFVLENKSTKTFVGYSSDDIVYLLKRGLDEQTLLYTEENGKVTGVLLAESRVIDGVKVMFVTENLAMNISNLRKFAHVSKSRFPEHQLQWLRHGKFKHFNTSRIYEKLKV